MRSFPSIPSVLHPLSLLAFAAFLAGIPAPARAQSETASHASQTSLDAVVVVPSAALDLLAAGGELSVAALRPVGDSIEVVLHVGSTGVEFSVHLGVEAVRTLDLAVGSVIAATAVGAGTLLNAGATVIAFVPCAIAAEMIHGRELRR